MKHSSNVPFSYFILRGLKNGYSTKVNSKIQHGVAKFATILLHLSAYKLMMILGSSASTDTSTTTEMKHHIFQTWGLILPMRISLKPR
jgi:hypothetical protein